MNVSVIPYVGGKNRLIDDLKGIIEYCSREYKLKGFLDVCGGSAKVLMNLNLYCFEHRLYNDYNLGLCRLFACLSSEKLTVAMINKLLDIEYTRENFIKAKELYNKEETDFVSSAAFTYLLAKRSLRGDMSNYREISNSQQRIHNRDLYRLVMCNVLLKDVEFRHGDCLNIIRAYNNERDYFCYIDPPYVTESKKIKKSSYEVEEMLPFDHENMINLLLETKMKVMISGYDNRVYDRLNEENGWHKIFLKQLNGGQSGSGSADEYIWTNFDIPSYLLE